MSMDTARNITELQNLYPLQGNEQVQLFHKISKELRCTVCQNQSLFDSVAPMAINLRQEVYRQVREGHSEGEIITFMVNRYGEAIFYNPPLQISTGFLWLGPLCMLVLGAFMLRKHFKSYKSI